MFEILLHCNPKNCIMYEQLVMDYYQPKYNCVMIAGNGNWLGKKHSDQTREKIRNSKLGQKHSEVTKQLMSKQRSGDKHPLYGKRHSVEAKEKMSKARKGVFIGSKSPSSKLTESDILEIIRLLNSGITGRNIADQFGVNESTISQIKLKKTWRHIKR